MSRRYATSDRLPPTGAPGARFAYSNTNYTLLGMVAEAADGRPIEKAIKARVTGPLSMEVSTVTVSQLTW